jgi:hypothetical protein
LSNKQEDVDAHIQKETIHCDIYLLSLRRIKTPNLGHQVLSHVTVLRRRGKQKLQDVVIEREGENEEKYPKALK